MNYLYVIRNTTKLFNKYITLLLKLSDFLNIYVTKINDHPNTPNIFMLA
jgi:hypothetical protein